MAIQFTWPTPGVTRTTCLFRCKCSWHKNSDGGLGHSGIDIAASSGVSIRAAAGGTVDHVGSDPKGYGNYIIIKHDNTYKTLYAHCSSITVRSGSVKGGQEIAKVGSTGNSSGPHLHFEVRVNGVKKNPLDYVKPGSVSTPTPTPQPGCPYPEPTVALKKGSSGNGVRWIQWHLNRKGASLVVDGSFGPLTDTAVRNFQRSKGLVVDGIVGPATRAKLKA